MMQVTPSPHEHSSPLASVEKVQFEIDAVSKPETPEAFMALNKEERVCVLDANLREDGFELPDGFSWGYLRADELPDLRKTMDLVYNCQYPYPPSEAHLSERFHYLVVRDGDDEIVAAARTGQIVPGSDDWHELGGLMVIPSHRMDLHGRVRAQAREAARVQELVEAEMQALQSIGAKGEKLESVGIREKSFPEPREEFVFKKRVEEGQERDVKFHEFLTAARLMVLKYLKTVGFYSETVAHHSRSQANLERNGGVQLGIMPAAYGELLVGFVTAEQMNPYDPENYVMTTERGDCSARMQKNDKGDWVLTAQPLTVTMMWKVLRPEAATMGQRALYLSEACEAMGIVLPKEVLARGFYEEMEGEFPGVKVYDPIGQRGSRFVDIPANWAGDSERTMRAYEAQGFMPAGFVPGVRKHPETGQSFDDMRMWKPAPDENGVAGGELVDFGMIRVTEGAASACHRVQRKAYERMTRISDVFAELEEDDSDEVSLVHVLDGPLESPSQLASAK